MDCNDKSVGILLSDYTTGNLDEWNKALVDKHLDQCASCRELNSVIKILSTRKDSISNLPTQDDSEIGHLTVLQIATFYSAPDTMTEQELGDFRKHINSCPACALDLDFLTSLEHDLLKAVESERARLPASKLTPNRWFWRRIPARTIAIAAIFLVMAVTFGLWRQNVPDLTSTAITELYELKRGATEIPTVMKIAERPLVRVDVPVPHNSKLFSYQVSIRPANGLIDNISISMDFATPLLIHLVIDSRGLADGEYNLTITEIGSGQDSVQTYHFPLLLRTGE